MPTSVWIMLLCFVTFYVVGSIIAKVKEKHEKLDKITKELEKLKSKVEKNSPE